MKLSAVALCLALVASAASANILSNGDFGAQMTPFNPSAAAADRLLSVLPAGTWYTPSGAGIDNWDCRWRVDEANQWASGQYNGYDKTFNQFAASMGAGTYTISFDYKMPTAPAWNSSVIVYALSGGCSITGSGFSTNSGAGTRTQLFSLNPVAAQADWANFSADFTVDETAGALGFIGVAIRGNGDAAWLIDNFSIVPEPATLSLLGLGALGLLRRRR